MAEGALMGAGNPTIYGDYVAPALSRRGGGPWHIQGDRPDVTLCGQHLTGSLSRMHVCLLECSRCMSLGATHPACEQLSRPGVRVHNHPPYRLVCNERTVGDQLRVACLDDDGSDR